MADQHYICTTATSPALYPSRHVIAKNVAASTPVPPDWLAILRPMPAGVTPIDPYEFDCAAIAREAAAAEAFQIEASKPRHSYTSSQVADMLGVTLDELTEVLHHLALPAPRLAFNTDGHPWSGPVSAFHLHDGPSVDVYVERIERLFGKRKVAKR